MNIDILTQGAFWSVNKKLSKKIGIEAALFLSELIGKHFYFADRGECIESNGLLYFYFTAEAIEENTTLTYSVQKKVIKILEKEGFIATKLMGIPAKLHFAIIENKISLFLNTGFEENQKLYIKNKEIKNKDKEEIYKDLPIFEELSEAIETRRQKKEKEFERFWNLYDKKKGNKDAVFIKWCSLSESIKTLIFQRLPEYVESTPDKQFRLNPQSYLNQKAWNNEIIPQKICGKQNTNIGIGEFINSNGERTYGSGFAIVPKDAPPRPSDQYIWSKNEAKWKIQ